MSKLDSYKVIITENGYSWESPKLGWKIEFAYEYIKAACRQIQNNTNRVFNKLKVKVLKNGKEIKTYEGTAGKILFDMDDYYI